MHIGLTLPNYRRLATTDNLRMTAEKAEAYGFHSLWVTDHVIMPTGLAERMGPVVFEPFTTLAYFAARTTLVRLGLSVTPIAYRHPLLQAKMIATIDQLSGGRAIYGGAAGYAREEFDALGVEYSRRGAISDEYLQAIVAAWVQDRPCFKGKYVRFSNITADPKPLQKPRPEIWIGGDSDAAFRRAARFGDGWHGKTESYSVTPRTRAAAHRPSTLGGLESLVGRIREVAEQVGRDPQSIRISLKEDIVLIDAPARSESAFHGSVDKILGDIQRAAELGVELIVFSSNVSSSGERMEPIDVLGQEILPRLRSGAGVKS